MTSDEEDFVERLGRHFEADGVPRIGGRLYGYLLLQEQPRSLDELATALNVSKGSVSTNARLLMRWGLIDRVTRPGDRRDFYAPAADLAGVLEIRLQRVREMSELLAVGARAVPAERPEAAERLAQMARFNAEAAERLEGLRNSWFGPDAG